MEAELLETENVWKPARLRGSLVDQDKTADLSKKVRGILNKLTPQKFHTLVQQLQALPIDSSERLHGVIDLVFEKATSEPMYSTVYAQTCKVLSNMQVANGSENGQPENFRKLLLSRCQHEFEKNTRADLKHDERLGEIEQCIDSERKQELLLEFEEIGRRLQMKSVGNIRFVGELFKLGMVTSNIMHRCIQALLKQRDEVSLECLCVLLTTIGKDLECKKRDLSKYFEEMKVLSKQQGQISFRVRFVLRDVIELRDKKWVPQRDNSIPKTIDQIQREAEREAMMDMQMPSRSGSRDGGRGLDEWGGDRSQRGGTSGARQQSFQRKYLYLPSSRMRIKVSDLMNVSLSGSHQFDSQTRGARCDSDSDFSRASDTSAGLEEVDDDENGVGVSSCPYGKQHPSSDTECEEVGHTGRNVLSAKNEECQVQTVSNTTPLELSAGECSLVAQTPALPSSQSRDDVAAVDSVVSDGDMCRNLSQLFPDQVVKKIQLILEEFLSNNNIQESMLSVSEAFPPSDMGTFVVGAVTLLLEQPASVRSDVGNLMAHLVEEGVLTTQQLLEGLKEVAGAAADLTTDMPKVWLSLAEILVSMLSTEVLSSSDLKTATAGLHKLVIKILHLLQKEKGPDWISQRWELTGISWKDFAHADSESRIVKENDLHQKVRGLLNELTPQNFHVLMRQLQTLLVDNSRQLPCVVDLVFEKAVSEPTYSAVYAQVCKALSDVRMRGSREEGSPNFHRLLLRRCRHEFENNWLADLECDEMESCTYPEEREEMQLEMNNQLRMKSIGFIRFVGELFKVGMLTQNVMHRYIQGLLKQGDEVSLECLCELLTAVGKHIDSTKREKERGKEKEEEKEAREEQLDGEDEQKLVGLPNEVTEKVSAVVLEEEMEAEISENTPPEPISTEPEQTHREGQWSPFNPDGLKKYEREFLMKLRDTPEAKKQPEMCSDVLYFLLKDKVNMPRLPDPSTGPRDNFTRTFTKSQSFHGDLSKYFEEMKVLSKQSGQISSRVRLMLQNVIELRDNNWVPRRDDSAQKTIEQIQHKAERESMMEMWVQYGGGGRSRGSGHDSRGGHRRNRGGPSEDGWQSVQRKNLDTSKLRIKVSDLMNVSLGGSNQFAAWTQAADRSSAFPQTSNTSAALQDAEDKKSGVGMFSRPYGKQPASSNMEREKAMNTLRNFVSAEKEERQARTASSGTPSQSSSREGSSARQAPAPSSSQSRDDLAAATQPVASGSSAISDQDTRKNLPHLNPNQVAKKIQFILEEFVNNNNYKESALSVSETFPPSNMDVFVIETMNILLERSAPVRSNVGKLMGHLMKEGVLTTEQFLQGFKGIAEVADDLAIDVPEVRIKLAEILVPMLSTEVLSFSELKTAATGLHQLVVEILRLLVKEKGSGWIRERWDMAGMSWKDFAPANCIDRIVKENKLEFTVGDSVSLAAETIHAKLLQMMRPEQGPPATTDQVTKWISANVGDRAKTPEFIRVLTTAVCESVYRAASSKKFDEVLFTKYVTLLQKYINMNEELELHCLYAVQELNHRLGQPSGLLCSLFQSLWDYGCVAHETFLKWEQSKDPAFLQGKGIALESLTVFFSAVREADEDSSDECASGQ